jgi:hypothetical protein
MKNILAENLLRFGVKNLSEADKLRLEQKTPTAPAVAGKTPTAAPKTPAKKVQVSFNMSTGAGLRQNLKVTECKVYGTYMQDPKTRKYGPPNQLVLQLSQNGKPVNIIFRLNTMTNTYLMENNTLKGDKLVDYLRYNTEHIVDKNPATALTQIIENIKNETGVAVNIDSTVVNNIRSAYDIYWKTGIVDINQMTITAGVLAPYKRAVLDKYINPETNQEYIDSRKLVFGNGSAGFWIKNDKIAGVTNVSSRNEIINFLKSQKSVPEAMDNSTAYGKIIAQAQALYDQLNQ